MSGVLDYRTPDAVLPRRGTAGLVFLLIFSYLFYGLLVAGLLETSKFKQIFADFKMELPALTKCVLVTADYVNRFYLWAVLAPLPALWSIGIWKIPNPDSRRWARLAAIVVMLAMAVLVLLGMFLPMIQLIDGIKSADKKGDTRGRLHAHIESLSQPDCSGVQ